MTAAEIERVLRGRLLVRGNSVRYRFPRQRADRIARCLAALRDATLPTGGLELRDFLCGLPGIGPKTASWIVRNRTGCDLVAILDIHVIRACIAARVFEPDASPARSYFSLEARYLEFARALSARPSVLDGVIWYYMRSFPRSWTERGLSAPLGGARQARLPA